MIAKPIVFFGSELIVACDAKCHKAWGISTRPRTRLSDEEDDIEWHSDNELGDAPEDPGTYEGGHGKPINDFLNKWCVRECERSILVKHCENFDLPDWSGRIKNMN